MSGSSGPPAYTQAEFLAAFQGLLPTGPVWPRDPDTVQAQTLNALMPTYVRQAARAANLLIDAFPATTVELLPQWEATLGLPDICTVASPSLEQRQAAVVAKLIATGGQSIPYFVAVAAALGFTISVVEFAPFRAGISRAGDNDNGLDWAFTWLVLAPESTVTYFAAGVSEAGDPLATWGNAEMQCRLTRIAPAHTILLFAYGDGGYVVAQGTLPSLHISPGVITSIASGPTVTISPGVISAGAVTVSPSTLAFPSTAPGSSASLTVVLTNTGTSPLVISGVTTTGDFAVTGETSP